MTIASRPGSSPQAKRAKHGPGVAAEPAERGGGGGEGPPVPAGVGDEQDHVIGAAVPALPLESSLEGLKVVEHGLRLDVAAPAAPGDQRIPGAQVALDRDRHLGSPSQARVKTGAEPREQTLLPGVAHRVAGGVRPESHVEPDEGTERDVFADRHRPTARERPRRGASRESGSLPEVGDAQAGATATSLDLRQETSFVVRRDSSGSDEHTLSRRHQRIVPDAASLAVIRARRGRCVDRRSPSVAHASNVGRFDGRTMRSVHDATFEQGFAGRSAHLAHARRTGRAGTAR